MSRINIYVIAVLAFVCLNAKLSAQSEMEDVLLLKTAEVIRGEIQKNVKEEYVEILVRDSLLRIEWEDIHLITEEIKRNRTRTEKKPTRRFKEQTGGRFGFIIEPSYFMTFNKGSNFSSLGIGVVPHYRLSQSFLIGLATGFRNPLGTERFLVPLLLDIRVRGKSRIAPIGAGSVGCMFIHDRYLATLGFSFNFKAGLSIGGKQGRSFDILVGFDNSVQRYERQRASSLGPAFRDEALNSLSFSLAFVL